MSSNQIMVRQMGTFIVTQRSKDGFFNATELLKQWNSPSNLNTQNFGYLKNKDLDDFFSNKNTKEFIEALQVEENLNTPKLVYLKTRGKYNGGTWMHPILFIKFAMWLNPRFEVQVIKFVYDQMIQYRNDAGDAYRELSAAVMKIVPRDYMPKAMRKIGEALNWIIFNQHEKMLRNKHGNEEAQRDLFQLEKKVADLINEGFIRSFDSLITYLRKQWHRRNDPAIFVA